MMKFKTLIITLAFISLLSDAQNKNDFIDIVIDKEITEVQPMTGIVFWQGSYTNTDAISLEFSYMLFNDVVSDSGVYDWSVVDDKLEDISSRNHQAIFRFRYAYVGEETSVPDYLKARPDYNETMGISEGQETWFPDWTNEELKRFTLEFYTQFAERYDNDPRLAFIQVGFGLWGEYHIYDGPFELGVTFPDKDFQESFFRHLEEVWQNKYWSISIDAADDTYSPFEENPELLDIKFGLFDDSFMHKDHSGYNEESWNFFDRTRYQIAPAGGEFSYYTHYDQAHVLDLPDGPYGESFESFSNRFHITYMIGADQPQYQTMERIKQASMATGYRFKIVSFKASSDSSIIQIINEGDAPIYYDAWPTVNGVRATESLKYLQDDEIKEFHIASGGENPVLTIESDAILPTQTIGYFGTLNSNVTEQSMESDINVYPTKLKKGQNLQIKSSSHQSGSLNMFDFKGHLIYQEDIRGDKTINTTRFLSGMYLLNVQEGNFQQTFKILIL